MPVASRHEKPDRARALLVDAALIAAVLIVYSQVVRFDFVRIDDPQYVASNEHVATGLSIANVAWAFTSFEASNWHPLTWISLMIDAQVGGSDPRVFHVTNVLLHLANTLLLFHGLRRWTGATGRSAFVAALFAVHPLHAESVAWVTERKDVLSTLFGFLALGAYARYTRGPSVGRHAAVFGLLALSLLSKPMLVTLPVVLLLLDIWPLGRLDAEGTRAVPARRVLEKLPLAALSAASCAITLVAQRDAVGTLEAVPLAARLGNALVSYGAYAAKMLWPTALSVHYPYIWPLPVWQPVLSAAFLAGATWLAVRQARHCPWFLAGWLWYVVSLVPVIGLVQVGAQSRADRYAYVPLVGLYVVVSWGARELLLRRGRPAPVRRAVAAIAAVAVVCALAWRAHAQVGTWRDNLALFRNAVQANPDNGLALMGLARELAKQGRDGEAATGYLEASRRLPQNVLLRGELAEVLLRLGRTAEAVEAYRELARLDPATPAVHSNLGVLLMREGRLEEAAAALTEALARAPADARVRTMLGLVLTRLGRLEDAEQRLSEALRLDPKDLTARKGLAVVLGRTGRTDEALDQLRTVLETGPPEADVHFNCATLLMRKGDPAGAEEHFLAAIRLDPRSSKTRRGYASLLVGLGRFEEAARQLSEAARLAPEDPAIAADLARARSRAQSRR